MYGHWFVVASQKTVKIFSEEPGRAQLHPLKEFDNPLGRERNRALVRKQAGRGTKSVGVGSVYYSERKRKDPHEEAARQFAKEVADFLQNEYRNKNLKSLTIAAEPHFLGKLRGAMSSNMKSLVTEWIQKDFLKTPQKKLTRRLVNENSKH